MVSKYDEKVMKFDEIWWKYDKIIEIQYLVTWMTYIFIGQECRLYDQINHK